MRSWRVDHVARRLVQLVAEHGAPNSFACAEVGDGRVIAPVQVGLVGRRYADDLAAALRDHFATFTVEYSNRRFHAKPQETR